MATALPKKRSKRSSKPDPNKESSSHESSIGKVLVRIPLALLFLFIIFLWSSSTTFISGSIVHVCVTSRKLSNLYCLSAGTQPVNFEIPLPLVNTTTKVSNPVDESPQDIINVEEKFQASGSSSLSKRDSGIMSSVVRHDRDEFANDANQVSNPNKIIRVMETTESPVSNSSRNPDSAIMSSALGHDGEGARQDSTKDAIQEGNPNKILGIAERTELPISDSRRNPDSVVIQSLFYGSPIIKASGDTGGDDEVAIAMKEVQDNMQILRSYVSKDKESKCEGRGIYVYDLPAKFNKDLVTQCHEMMPWMDFCKFFSNQALGESLWELGPGWYNTHQYSLEPIFHSRVSSHPCRVWSVYDAKLFYVPYYGGLDILRWHFKKNITNNVKDKLPSELIEWLQLQDSWTKKFGFDHVFVLGKISWDFRRPENSSWGTRLLEQEEMQNPMKLLIERQPWHGNDVGIPHPTLFHPRSDADIEAWQKKIMEGERRTLVSFAGAPRPQAVDNIRSVLIEQCTSSDKCKHLDCKGGSCTRPKDIIDLFTGSEFCLQPAGDSPTRKSLFDSLISGCIPVLFDPFTAFYQYAWHLPEDFKMYSVFVDKEVLKRREVNVVETLIRTTDEERKEMRRYIVYELMPGLVYADPNSKLEKYQDAFSISINNLLERVSRLP